MTRARDDGGSALLLIVGFALVLIGLVAVVVDVSTVMLAQRGAASFADGAASAAAQQLDEAGLGATATVTATRQVRLPLRAPGGPVSTTVTVVATVRSPVVVP